MNAYVIFKTSSPLLILHSCGKKWKSQIQIDGVQYYLGVFATQEQAAEEYRIAAKRLGKFEDREYSDAFIEERQYQQHVISNSEQNHSSSSGSNEFDSATTSGSSSSSGSGSTSTVLQNNTLDEERKVGDGSNNLFYMVPIAETSNIAAKIKLGEIGNEILSRVYTRKENPGTPSLTALRYNLIQSVRALRNSNIISTPPPYNPSDFSPLVNRNAFFSPITDDETIFEEV
jgi:hypothetical protein